MRQLLNVMMCGALLLGLAGGNREARASEANNGSPADTSISKSMAPDGVRIPTPTVYMREVTMRRFRFRKIKAIKWAEVVANVAAGPTGLDLNSAAVRKLPQGSAFWGKKRGIGDGLRRSKKKCTDANDQSCGQLQQPGFCWWFAPQHAGIYNDYANLNEFCPTIDLCARFFELDPGKTKKANRFQANAEEAQSCLSEVFGPGATGSSASICHSMNPSWSLCDVVDDVSSNIPNYLFPPQLLGRFTTGGGPGDTPYLTTLNIPPFDQCNWDQSGQQWWGDITTPSQKTAQVEFDVVLQPRGCGNDTGVPLSPCIPCPDATPQSPVDLAHFKYFENSGCEITGTVYTNNTDLRSAAAYIGYRHFEVYFDIDNNVNTGATSYPGCGAEYYIELILHSDGTNLTASRAIYRWAGGNNWQANVNQNGMYDVSLENCHWSFTVNKADIGYPANSMAAWVITRDNSNTIVDELPTGVCSNRLPIGPLNQDQICPRVSSVDAASVTGGNATAPVNVEFDEAIAGVGSQDVAVVGPGTTPNFSLNWNKRILSFTPQTTWTPGHYTVTLQPSIIDCAGNRLQGDNTTCGTPYVFEFCVPNLGLTVRDSNGNEQEGFAVNQSIFLRGTGQTGISGAVNAYVMDDDAVIGLNGVRYIDQTSDGPTVVNVVNGNIASTNLGSCPRPGVYGVFLDVNGNGAYDEQIDVTPNTCEGSFAVDPCTDDRLDGITCWWPLNETYANAGSINLGADSHGAYVGNPTPVQGKVAGAISFTGSNYINVPNNADMEISAGEDFSVSGWLKPTDATGGIQSILDKRGTTLGYHVALVGGKLVMNIDDPSGWTNYTSTTTLPNNVWTHFVCSNNRTQSNSLKIYLNGNLDATYDATGRSGDLTSGADLWIAGHHSQPNAGFKGAIDELAIWDSALSGGSGGDVDILYHMGLEGNSCADSTRTTGVPDDPSQAGGASAKDLGKAFPNPFKPSTTIRFSLPAAGSTDLSVYDVSGRRVRSLVTGPLQPGSHDVTWDGTDDSGRRLPGGIYFWRLSANGVTNTRKMIMLE